MILLDLSVLGNFSATPLPCRIQSHTMQWPIDKFKVTNFQVICFTSAEIRNFEESKWTKILK